MLQTDVSSAKEKTNSSKVVKSQLRSMYIFVMKVQLIDSVHLIHGGVAYSPKYP